MSGEIQFILASGSPRRKDLLERMGLRFAVEVPHADETLLEGESPGEHTLRLARDKAGLVAAKHRQSWVLAADTAVVIDGEILGKPSDREHAFAMLSRIQGREHTVVTAFCIQRADPPSRTCRAVESRVRMRGLTPQEIRWYINTNEPMDKAGSYAVQGIGASIVREVSGSYTNVVGLPLAEVIEEMERLEVLRLLGND